MMKYCYIVSEGPQDIEFLVSLLKNYSLKRVTRLSLLDPFWKPLVPTSFPIDDDLMKRVPVPVFLQSADLSIALHSAIGITRLSNTIEESLAVIPVTQIFGIGLVLDADDVKTPQERFGELLTKLAPIGLPLPTTPGEVVKNASPRFGVFITPNNSAAGTLEDILLACAQINYPDLVACATNYISNIDRTQLNQDDLKEIKKPAGENKAIVSSISSILRPGKTLQVSIQDNRWIDAQTISLDSVKLVKIFLDEITGFA
jgi:hypothetical protein